MRDAMPVVVKLYVGAVIAAGPENIPLASTFEDPARIPAPVFMGDFSSPGLRVAYAGLPLRAGQVVNFAQRGMRVRAQVLWTLQSGASIQSGLLVKSLHSLDDEARHYAALRTTAVTISRPSAASRLSRT